CETHFSCIDRRQRLASFAMACVIKISPINWRQFTALNTMHRTDFSSSYFVVSYCVGHCLPFLRCLNCRPPKAHHPGAPVPFDLQFVNRSISRCSFHFFSLTRRHLIVGGKFSQMKSS